MRPSRSDIQPERMRPEAFPNAPTTSVIVDKRRRRNSHALGERHQLADDHQARRTAQRIGHPHQVERGRAQHFARGEFTRGGRDLDAAAGDQPAGRYPAGGFLSSSAPISVITRKIAPRI